MQDARQDGSYLEERPVDDDDEAHAEHNHPGVHVPVVLERRHVRQPCLAGDEEKHGDHGVTERRKLRGSICEEPDTNLVAAQPVCESTGQNPAPPDTIMILVQFHAALVTIGQGLPRRRWK
eukprot:392058-Rhodomonas_salina.1